MNTTRRAPIGSLEGWPGCEYPETIPDSGFLGQAHLYIWYIFPMFHVVFGTFGNVVTAVVIFRNFRKITSTSVVLFALTCSDTIFLYTTPLRNWFLHVFKLDIRGFSLVGCKVIILFVYSCYQASSWFLVVLTAERLFCILRPHKVKLYFTARNATIAVCVISLVIIGQNSHVLYGFGNDPVDEFLGREDCIITEEDYVDFYKNYLHWIHFIVGYLLPCLSIIFGNSLIIYKLRTSPMATTGKYSPDRTTTKQKTPRKPNKLSKQTSNLTAMLILLCVIFFVSQTPLTVFLICESSLKYEVNKYACSDFSKYMDKAEKFKFTEAVVHNLGYMNASINFLLYVISGSRFRRDVKALLLCRQPSQSHGVFAETKSESVRAGSDIRRTDSV